MCNMDGRKDDIENGSPNEEEELYSDEDEDDEEMEAENEHVGQVIDVAFEANCPSDTDFHGIKRLLQQLFVKNLNEEISELTNLIISQDFVGCVLKQDNQEDDDDDDSDEEDKGNVFNINTVINISENQSLPCIEKINEFLTKKCTENFKADPSRMGNMLGNPSNQVGLLISERFINIPPQVALPSYTSLKEDIEKAVRKKKKFDFTRLVLISKTYRAKGDGGAMAGELFYTNSEEQLFSDFCEYQYTFSVSDQRDSIAEGQWDEEEGDMESLRTVMVFDASALGPMITKLKNEIPAT